MKFSFRLGVEPGGEGEGVDEREGAGQQQKLRPAGVHRQVPHVPRIRPHQVLRSSVADPHELDADPDPACHCDEDPDPAFHFDADPDPGPDPASK